MNPSLLLVAVLLARAAIALPTTAGFSVRLLGPAEQVDSRGRLLLAQAEAAPPRVDQLRREYYRLEDSRPSLGPPVALLCLGGSLALGTGVGVVMGLTGGAGGTLGGMFFLTIASVGFVAGAVLAVVGAVMLPRRISTGQRIDREMEELQDQMNETRMKSSGTMELERLPPAYDAPLLSLSFG